MIIITGHPCSRCGKPINGDRAGRPIAHSADECIANLQDRLTTALGRVGELIAIKLAWAHATAETCPNGEHHCACVPYLRAENERLGHLLGEDENIAHWIAETEQLRAAVAQIQDHFTRFVAAMDESPWVWNDEFTGDMQDAYNALSRAIADARPAETRP